jgi:hypothetical protein
VIRRALLSLFLLCSGGPSSSAQDAPPRLSTPAPSLKTQVETDRALRLAFETALSTDTESARRYLPLAAGRPWFEEMNFRDSCTLARALHQPADAAPPDPASETLAEKLVLAVGLHNPSLALRESSQYLPLAAGQRLFQQFVLSDPDEAVALASGTTRSARAFRDLLSSAGSPEFLLLARLAADPSIDLPRRSRLAILARSIARGRLSFQSALEISRDTHQFFATVVDMRTTADAADLPPLDRVLENESLILCRAAQESLPRVIATDLSRFRAPDLYSLLSLGRAEAPPAVFAAIFDRLLLPKWKAETPPAASLLAFLDRTHNWELRDFAAAALAAHRFDGLLAVAGSEVVDRLARGLDRSPDPLREAIRLAGIVDAAAGTPFLRQMAAIVSQEFLRCRAASDPRGTTLYGLLAARLSLDSIGAPYLPFFQSSETLDTATLFGQANLCIQRHFFYDDDDGVRSFESFRQTYQRDPAWEIEDRGDYLRLTGRGPEGRRIEIFANVPIDCHRPENRAREGEALRRQQAIAAALDARGLVPAVIVHRGHSFWVRQTLTYLAGTARLVILGSCGGTTEVHAVIEASHDAQVIATRGVGETEINDSLLKAVNDRILTGGRIIQWSEFWPELSARLGRSALFRDYIAPNQDPGTVFLCAYHRYLDAAN